MLSYALNDITQYFDVLRWRNFTATSSSFQSRRTIAPADPTIVGTSAPRRRSQPGPIPQLGKTLSLSYALNDITQ